MKRASSEDGRRPISKSNSNLVTIEIKLTQRLMGNQGLLSEPDFAETLSDFQACFVAVQESWLSVC